MKKKEDRINVRRRRKKTKEKKQKTKETEALVVGEFYLIQCRNCILGLIVL